MTQGVHQAVLDWSTGVIVKLAAALPKLATPVAATSPAVAASPNSASGGDSTGERHARNARRWLSDPRIWRAFVRSLRGGATAAAEPSTHLPQSASLGVLRAAIFAVRAGTGEATQGLEAVAGAGAESPISRGEHVTNGNGRGSSSRNARASGGDDGSAAGTETAAATAGDWAFVAILTLCGGGIVTAGDAGGGRGRRGGHSNGSMTKINSDVLSEIVPSLQTAGETEMAAGPRRRGGRGAVMRMSLDVYVTFLDEVIRGHVAAHQAPPPQVEPVGREVGGRGNGSGVTATAAVGVGVTAAGSGALPSPLAEGVMTELLRFLVVLQGQQTSRRKVNILFARKILVHVFCFGSVTLCVH